MNQLDVILAMKDISGRYSRNQITESEAVSELKNLIGAPSPSSLRWKVFIDNRLKGTVFSKIGKAHRKRLKKLAVQIDPYFARVDWGEN